MSIKTPRKRLVFSTLDTDSVNVNGNIVTIKGLPSFSKLDVDTTVCGRACPTACTPQAVTITPLPLSDGCECPFTWEIKVIQLPCLYTYRTGETFEHTEYYNYTDETGAALTVAGIVASIVAQINSNPDSIVTATAIGGAGSETAFTLTEKDCDSDNASCGFNFYSTNGTVSGAAAHARAILSPSEIAREFPITHMGFMSRPELAYCGSFCKYLLKIDPISRMPDDHMPDAWLNTYLEVEIFVNSAAASFFADWDTPMVTAFPCLGATLDPGD